MSIYLQLLCMKQGGKFQNKLIFWLSSHFSFVNVMIFNDMEIWNYTVIVVYLITITKTFFLHFDFFIHQTHKHLNKEKCYTSHLHFDFIYFHVLSEVWYNSGNILKIWYEVIVFVRCIIRTFYSVLLCLKKRFSHLPPPPPPFRKWAGLKILGYEN